jgi:hypothetical protein
MMIIQICGAFLTVVGLLLIVAGFAMSGAAPGTESLNIGLLVEKLSVVLIGCTFFSTGVNLLAKSR